MRSSVAPDATRDVLARDVPARDLLAREAPREAASRSAGASDISLIAKEDHFEGKLRTSRGVRILGTLNGQVESASQVTIEDEAKVTADITADEVVIAGEYSGKLVCRNRAEIRSTGRVSGSIETVKLMLHEGGYVDGELRMQKPQGGDGQSVLDSRAARRAGSDGASETASAKGHADKIESAGIDQPAKP